MARSAVASTVNVGKRPTTPEKGKPFRLHALLPGDLVREVDAIARQLTAEDAYKRPVTRTDALVLLLAEAVAARSKK